MKDILNKIADLKPEISSGQVGWRSPSNIALIKYWGKYGGQLPANASLSFTLSECHTETFVSYQPKQSASSQLQFLFEGKENEKFQQRIKGFLETITPELPVIGDLDFMIESKNSFPHSSGIASSASSMSAIALCLASIQQAATGNSLHETEFRKLSSYLARIGSGSACRSVYGGFTVWGESPRVEGSSDLYAVPLTENNFHTIFQTLQDDILIVEKGAKKVSSSAGHGLMHNHPFAIQRFEVARKNLNLILEHMKSGDIFEFGKWIEQEALMLHALMLTSDPSFILFKPNTIAIINTIRTYREETKTPVFFTLDAGANVHVIYPGEYQENVKSLIKSELLVFCENEQYLCDRIGRGPEMLTS